MRKFKFEKEANEMWNSLQASGLAVILCGCGYKYKSDEDLIEHQKICDCKHHDIYLGHK